MSGGAKKSTTKMAIMVMAVTVVARCSGFLRDVILGSVLGTSYVADAYNMAVSVPNILFANVVGAIGVTFIPVYVSTREQSGEKKGSLLTSNVFNIVLLLGVLISFVSVIAARPILSVLAFGFDNETLCVAVIVARIVFFTIGFLGINAVLTGYLNANNKFFITSILSLPYSAIIIAALLLYDRLGIQGVAYASLIGAGSQTVLLGINALLNGFRLKKIVDFKDKALRGMLLLALPTFIGNSIGQINATIDKMLASGLTEGSVSALSYANKLETFVVSVTAVAIGTVIYPQLSKFMVTHAEQALKNMLVKGINVVTILLMPITVAAVVLNQHIVKLLFERGAFSAQSTALTASALMFYSFGIVFYGYRDILARTFYAMKDTKTPMINGVLSLGVGVVLNIILVRYMAHNGLALATSISTAVAAGLLMYSLRKKIGGIGGKKMLSVFGKAAVSSAAMGVVVYFTHVPLSDLFAGSRFITELIVFVILVVEGVTVYFGLMIVLKVEELTWFLKKLYTK